MDAKADVMSLMDFPTPMPFIELLDRLKLKMKQPLKVYQDTALDSK